MNVRSVLLLIVFLIFSASGWTIDIKVSDSRANNFYMDALIWVLDKSGADYYLSTTEHSASSQARKAVLVQRGELDVMYAGTTAAMEEQLQPIRFPITRGLIGSRIIIINEKYNADYRKIKSIEDLKEYTGNLGFGWSEKEIFEAVGLKQEERIYDDIFTSINSGSRYYFSRGILEAYSELMDKENELPNLIVDKNILVRYISAVFFFINPKNIELKNILNEGFRKGYEDGSYIEFLYSHPLIKRSIEKAELEKRIVIDIPNPFFPRESLNIPSLYWHEE